LGLHEQDVPFSLEHIRQPNQGGTPYTYVIFR